MLYTQPTQTMSQIMMLFNTMPRNEQRELISSLNVAYRSQQESLKEKFERLYSQWWNETCVYSGINLCKNDTFYSIVSLGVGVLPYIEDKISELPKHTHRHLGWLKTYILKENE